MELSQIGYTKKSTGILGEVKIHIDEPYWEYALQSAFLFVEMDGYKVPFYVDSLTLDNRSTVKFEGIDRPDDAIRIAGRPLFLESKYILKQDIGRDELQFNFLKGFLANDFNSGEVALIIDIQAYPQQEMAVVKIIPSDRECLIPLSDEMILAWNEARKLIWFNLPSGMLNL